MRGNVAVHVGTGNYHPGTAQAYTDIGLMSADRELAEDVHHMFMQLTGLGRPPAMNKLLLAPVELYPSLLKMIEEEAEAAARGEKAQIVAKMNSLADPGMIQALYKASQAGVQIDLIVRGIGTKKPEKRPDLISAQIPKLFPVSLVNLYEKVVQLTNFLINCGLLPCKPARIRGVHGWVLDADG